jgi:hypothetical protein
MARLIKITYASLVVGLSGNSAITLTDRYRLSAGYTEFSLTFQCVVRHATRATFLAAEAALITAYSTPDAALEVQLGAGTDRHDYDPASNTGFNARPSLRKMAGEEDTANSAKYECSVTVQLPASLTGRSGRQSSTVSVDSTPAGKRTVTIEGVYTALSGNSAVAQYVSAGTTYCDTVITAIGGTFDLMTPVNTGSGFAAAAGFNYDDQNKVLRFKRVYEESIYNEGAGTASVSGVRRQSLVISRTRPTKAGEPAANVRPLVEMEARYSCFVDKNITQDLATLWEGTLRAHVVNELATMAQGSIVVSRDSVVFDRGENRIEAAFSCVIRSGGLIYAKLEFEDRIPSGLELAPVHSGDPYAVDDYRVHIAWIKVVRRTVVSSGAGGNVNIPAFPGFIEMERSRGTYRDQVGVEGERFPILYSLDTFVYRRANLSNLGGGSGQGSSTERSAPPADSDADKDRDLTVDEVLPGFGAGNS